jgi:arsenate reductase (thioredoxin)
MSDRNLNVLFVCTGNSARSVLAEGLMNHLGAARFRAFSAGSTPTRVVNPFALATLAQLGMPVDGFRSKSWSEFEGPGAPALDFVFTVCDNAAGEVCPIWPGQPMTAHWGLPDPAAVTGSDDDKRRAFMTTAVVLRRRIELLLALPLHRLERLSLQRELDDIGKATAPAADA